MGDSDDPGHEGREVGRELQGRHPLLRAGPPRRPQAAAGSTKNRNPSLSAGAHSCATKSSIGGTASQHSGVSLSKSYDRVRISMYDRVRSEHSNEGVHSVSVRSPATPVESQIAAGHSGRVAPHNPACSLVIFPSKEVAVLVELYPRFYACFPPSRYSGHTSKVRRVA